ncbi:MAG: hypothetical protein JEZ07_01630 [Phycisphaerae bacterium]|nr:hypothetical protein [Phycisphaerae bacterium]
MKITLIFFMLLCFCGCHQYRVTRIQIKPDSVKAEGARIVSDNIACVQKVIRSAAYGLGWRKHVIEECYRETIIDYYIFDEIHLSLYGKLGDNNEYIEIIIVESPYCSYSDVFEKTFNDVLRNLNPEFSPKRIDVIAKHKIRWPL